MHFWRDEDENEQKKTTHNTFIRTHTHERSTQSTSRTHMHVNKDRRRNYSNCTHMQMRSFIATYERLQIQIVCVRIVPYRQRLCRAPKTDEWLSFNKRHSRRTSRLHISVSVSPIYTHAFIHWLLLLLMGHFSLLFFGFFFCSLLPCFYCL